MYSKCNQVGCEGEDCMEYIVVKKTYTLEVPKHKYKQLLQELETEKLFHLTDDLIQVCNRLERMAEEQVIEEIEIDDGEY
jgi:hypothetical protein